MHEALRAACPLTPHLRPGPAPRSLTFLHRDGWFLLPKPQQNEEENQRYEDLKGQNPLEKEC